MRSFVIILYILKFNCMKKVMEGICKECLVSGAGVNARDGNGHAALHHALYKAHAACIERRLATGPDVNMQDSIDGRSSF